MLSILCCLVFLSVANCCHHKSAPKTSQRTYVIVHSNKVPCEVLGYCSTAGFQRSYVNVHSGNLQNLQTKSSMPTQKMHHHIQKPFDVVQHSRDRVTIHSKRKFFHPKQIVRTNLVLHSRAIKPG